MGNNWRIWVKYFLYYSCNFSANLKLCTNRMGSILGHLSLVSILFGQNRHGGSPSSSFQAFSYLLPSHYLRDYPMALSLLLGLANSFLWLPPYYQPSAPRFIRIIPLMWMLPSTSRSLCIYMSLVSTTLWASIKKVTTWPYRT